MTLILALTKIKDCWNKKFPAGTTPSKDMQDIYDGILKKETRYIQQENALIVGYSGSGLTADKITSANHNLCCINEEILELINSLSSLLKCEPTGQTKPKIIDKLARPGGVSLRPSKKGSYK